MKIFGFPQLLFFAIAALTLACNKDSDSDSSDDVPTALVAIEEASDYNIESNLANQIIFDGETIVIKGEGLVVSDKTVTINKAGSYTATGIGSDGQILVAPDSGAVIKLQLDNLNLTSKTNAPIVISNGRKTIIHLKQNTLNTLTDGGTYTKADLGQNATLFANTHMAITGQGNLAINANFEDGIGSKDGLVINSGTITIKAKDEGIRGKDFLVMHDGTIDVTTTGGDGLKSDNIGFTDFGYIQIDKGNIKINSKGDGISAESYVNILDGVYDLTCGGGSTSSVSGEASAKGIKANTKINIAVNTASINTADDGIHSDADVIIEKGDYQISTADDGIRGTKSILIKDATMHITKSYEGIETNDLTIEQGYYHIIASNDALNATAGTRVHKDDGSKITIKGGYFILDGLSGDPLDSNGSIEMTDGTVVIHGPSKNPEVPIDYNGTFNVSKGTVMATGSSTQMFQTPSASSAIKSLRLIFGSQNAAATIINIQDEGGNSIVTFKPNRAYLAVSFTSEKLVQGKTYTVYTGGSATGDNKGGYFEGGAYSGGTKRGTFTVSGQITSVNM